MVNNTRFSVWKCISFFSFFFVVSLNLTLLHCECNIQSKKSQWFSDFFEEGRKTLKASQLKPLLLNWNISTLMLSKTHQLVKYLMLYSDVQMTALKTFAHNLLCASQWLSVFPFKEKCILIERDRSFIWL